MKIGVHILLVMRIPISQSGLSLNRTEATNTINLLLYLLEQSLRLLCLPAYNKAFI